MGENGVLKLVPILRRKQALLTECLIVVDCAMLNVGKNSRSIEVFSEISQPLSSYKYLCTLLDSIFDVRISLLNRFRVNERAMCSVRVERIANFESFDLFSKTRGKFVVDRVVYVDSGLD